MAQLPGGPMVRRHVLVTGATSGIGKATALGLARLGARVSIVGRDARRTEAAADEIRAAGRRRVSVFLADLSSQAQVRRLADQVLAGMPRIDVLVNNAGGYWNTRHLTDDGLERTFALNHLAPFLLTNLLLDRLTESAPARVVTVSSGSRPAGGSTSTTCRANRITPAHARTASRSSPTSCSPTSSRGRRRPRR